MNASMFPSAWKKLQVPEGFGDSVSIAGFTLTADENRQVTVPVEFAPQLVQHGLTEVQEDVSAPAVKNGKRKA